MEQRQIKGNKSSYFKKSENKKIETISKYVNLGVNSNFNVNETVYILSETEYNQLTELNNSDATKEIAKLKDTINDLTNKLANVTANNEKQSNTIKELTKTIGDNETKITELNNIISDKDNEINTYNDVDIGELQQKITDLETTNKDVSNEINTKTNYIVYMEQLQTDYIKLLAYYNLYFENYKNRNIIKRIANTDVNNDVDKPTLKHLDLKGNTINKDNTEPITIANTKDKETD